MWFHHLLNLLRFTVALFVGAIGTSVLGFITLLLDSIVSVAVTLYRVLRKGGIDAMKRHWKGNTVIALRTVFWVTLFIYGPIFLYSFSRAVYVDHTNLADNNRRLIAENKTLSEDLDWRKHNISTNDAVFPTIIYMLQAFQIYRGAMRGRPCVICFLAPAQSLALASTMAQFSNSVSGCSTFGPSGPGNPDLDEAAMQGIQPDVILLHAPREDKAADQLEMYLGNQIQVRRSYKPIGIPKKRLYVSQHNYSESFIWLQFGQNVKWNSERQVGRK